MKKLLLLLIILTNLPLMATKKNSVEPSFNKVYRTDRIGDSYHFLLLNQKGKYFYLFTNKTATLSSSELKSSTILKLLKKKQSWGKAFYKNGEFILKNSKLYTKLLWKPIKILSDKKIKYLNKIFYLQ